jgi:hypothetical protein
MPVITRQDVIDNYIKYTGTAPTTAQINEHTGQTVPNVAAAAKNFFQPQQPSGGGGGGGSEMPEFPEFPGLSDEEKGLIKQQTELIKLQMEDLKRQNTLNAELFPLQKQLFEFQLKFATELFPQQKAMIEQMLAESQPTATQREITRLSDERALASLRGEPIPLSAEQQGQLDTIYNQAGETGARDLRQFAEEMAASRGMSLSDSPIGDVALREAQNLFAGLQASKAQASLDLGQSQQAFGEGVRQFQSGLQQQALQNRLALAAGASSQPSLGAVNASGLIGSFQGSLASMAQNRSSQAQYGLGVAQMGLQNRQFLEGINQSNLDRTSRERIAGQQNPGYPGIGFNPQTVSAFAPVAVAGLGAAAAYWSTARLKKDITPLDPAEFEAAAEARGLPLDAYDEALTSLRDTPITRWKYKWEGDEVLPHIGPILELSPPEFSRDGLRLDMLDYAGMTHAGLKALDRTVRRLEAKVG